MTAMEPLPQNELRDLYRELILDHARNPRHFGKLENASHQADGINPLCGDKLRLYLRVDKDERIAAAAFEGSGCAISVASASLLTETVAGISCAEAKDYSNDVIQLLVEDGSKELRPELHKLNALAGVREFPARVKCASLAWRALCSAIDNENSPISTEH